jgi:hypothetical protein
MLFDLQVPADAAYGKLNVLAGTRNDLVLTLPAIAAAATGALTADAAGGVLVNNAINAAVSSLTAANFSAVQINSGDLIRNGATSIVAVNASTTAQTYCINLNCLLGTLCQNYFPLFACTSAPLRMEITLVSDLFKAMNVTLAPTIGAVLGYSGLLSNVEYIANFIELGDSAMATVASSLQGQPLQFVVPDYRNYQYSYSLAAAGTVTQVSMAIPCKFSSLKSLFVTVRDKGTGALTFFPFSSVNMGILDYQFRIGPSIFPPKPVSTLPEMFAETIKAMGSMSDLNYQPSIEKASYSTVVSSALAAVNETNGASAITSGSFYIGLDMENWVGAPKDNIFAGFNTNVDDCYAIMNFNGSGGATTTRFDAFALFDCCIVFENQTAYVRY